MDLALIIDDTINQYKHKTPMPLKSKFKKIFDDAWGKAHLMQMEDLPAEEKYAFSLFYKKANDTITAINSLLTYYKKNGYSYEYVKFVAELDHHDVPTFKNDLEWLYDGFFWRSTMAKYM